MYNIDNFYKQDKKFRIEAVIMDGQWYNIEKWKKISNVSIEDINEWINQNKEILINRGDSYRVSAETIQNWYNKQNILLETEIIPKNFPPKIWDKKTETQHFLDNPRKLLSHTSILTNDEKIVEKIKKISLYYGWFRKIENNKYHIYSMNCKEMKERIEKSLTEKEKEKIQIKLRTGYLRRDIDKFSNKFMEEAFLFYLPYIKSLLKNQKDTLNIFLPDQNEQDLQIYKWLTLAMEKFDETQNIPFAAYLTNVVPKWVYDLPDMELGKDLARFQRNKKKIIEEFPEISQEEMIKKLKMTKKDFLYFDELDRNWHNIKNPTTFTWDDTKNEKIPYKEQKLINDERFFSYKLSLSILETIEETSLVDEGIILIENIGKNNFLNLEKISKTFKDSLYKKLKNKEIFN